MRVARDIKSLLKGEKPLRVENMTGGQVMFRANGKTVVLNPGLTDISRYRSDILQDTKEFKERLENGTLLRLSVG